MDPLAQELKEVNASTVRMLGSVREGVELARQALIEADLEAAERCIAGDAAIDAAQQRLEQRILTIIARRQPAARELRFLGSVFLSLTDIERAGDYAVHVARAGAELAKEPPLKKYIDMARILAIISDMLAVTMRSFEAEDVAAARRVIEMDDEIDELYEQIQRELLTYMMADPRTINAATKLLAVARYLERCGDHIENVNEHVLFWLTGERI
jgi:phosphate transport system protein